MADNTDYFLDLIDSGQMEIDDDGNVWLPLHFDKTRENKTINAKIVNGKLFVENFYTRFTGQGKERYVFYKNKTISIARLMWTMFNGAIPRGYILQYKDNNKSNVSIDNLKLVNKRDILARARKKLEEKRKGKENNGTQI